MEEKPTNPYGQNFTQGFQKSPEWLQEYLQAKSGYNRGTWMDPSDVYQERAPQFNQVFNRVGQDKFFNPAFMDKGSYYQDMNRYDPFARQTQTQSRSFQRQYGDDSIRASQIWNYNLDPFTDSISDGQMSWSRRPEFSFQGNRGGSGAAIYNNGSSNDFMGGFTKDQQKMLEDYYKWQSWRPT